MGLSLYGLQMYRLVVDKKNLEETFDVLEDIYSIADLEYGILDNLFKDKTN